MENGTVHSGEAVPWGRVERDLRAHSSVREVAVVQLPENAQGGLVGAAVVVRKGAILSIREMREYAMAHLEPHEIPDIWSLRVEPLPRDANGDISHIRIKEIWRVLLAPDPFFD